MTSTFVNDLRLNEMATGDQSGSWGTVTNTNLELIGEALGYGTEGITTNADTHTSTIADGATDPVRALYVEYTGTLDSACTVTIAPNTVNKVCFIENGTSGSQNIIIKQGSGATITIPPGDTKAVYLDGAGSGAKVVDAFASLSVVDLKVQDDLTVTDDAAIGGLLTVTGGALLNGTTPTLTIGDAGAEDAKIVFDGNAADYHVGLDDSEDALQIGLGAALGTTPRITIRSTEVAVNDLGIDLDFRVESNGQANMLFVDGGNNAVVIGHNDATNGTFASSQALQVVGTGFTTSSVGISRFSADANAGSIIFAKSRAAGIGTDTVVQDNDTLGSIGFSGADGTDLATQGASIVAAVDGTPGGNDMPGRLVFNTTGDGNSSVTERVRIDSSGNLLVGGTSYEGSSSSNASSAFLGSNGFISANVTNDFGLQVNRTGTDGALLNLRKNGGDVGSIGTVNSTLVIGSGDTGLLFSSGNDVIVPRNSDTSVRDAAIDLGDSGSRFKDLYLSGGVFLGGTGAANKISDFETGTWTPASVGVTLNISPSKSKYTKIGNTVICSTELTIASNNHAAQLRVTLPFTVTACADGGFVRYSNAGSSTPSFAITNDNNADIIFYDANGSGASFASVSTKRVDFLAIYRTS